MFDFAAEHEIVLALSENEGVFVLTACALVLGVVLLAKGDSFLAGSLD